MNPFTGGCHFSEGCQKFEKSCGSCPTLGSDNDRDLSFEILRRKVEAMNRLAEEKLTIVCVSDWMMDNVRRSRVFRKFECKKITTGVNVELFRPRDKALLRKKHGIAVDKKVVLFVADRGHIRRRKGWNYVSDICEKLQTQPTVLTVLIGTDECNLSEADKALVLHTGEIGSPKTIAEFYALADAFVYTGIDDNLPNTVLEAMASGLVVFSFNTGGVPDVVEDGINGYLFTKGDVGALASKLKDFLVVEDQDSSISLNARHRIVESFSAESEGRSYLELYQTLLGTG